MNLLLLAACCVLPAAPRIDSRLEQVGPANVAPTRSADQTRAVILLHGFIFHVKERSVSKPTFRPWQRPGCLLVKALEKEADVFAFAYGQNASIDDIVRAGGVREAVAAVKKLGYREIVLIGHSAGGVVARQLVEDHPNLGVTKVIQVCSPNGGTPTAKAALHASQRAFLDSLTEEGRKKTLATRKDRKIPASIEFVCVLGQMEGNAETDGVVPCCCQWTPDLCKQGIPVVPLAVSHHQTTRTAKGAEALVKLVREKQPRWKPDQVERLSRQLFEKESAPPQDR